MSSTELDRGRDLASLAPRAVPSPPPEWGSGVDPAVLVDLSPDAAFVIDVDGRLRYANQAAETMFGGVAAEHIGSSVLELVHPDDAKVVMSSLHAVLNKPVGTPVEVRVLGPSGQWRWIEVIGRDCRAVAGIEGILCSGRDLTERRMWEVAANDVVLLQQVVQHAATIVLCLDAEGRVTSVNGAFTRLLGHDPSVVVGSALLAFVSPSHQRILTDALAGASWAGATGVEVAMRAADGQPDSLIRLEIVNLVADPVVAGYIVTGYDVSDLQDAKRQLEHLATHDALTGLANRALLHDRLHRLLTAQEPLALLYVDLDEFKPVNDRLGHSAGDELLCCVAGRLAAAVDAGDLVARVGGDEFVVMARGVTELAQATALAERLEAIVRAPFGLRSGIVQVSASVGAVIAGPESSALGLLGEADLAMYVAKAGRTGRWPPLDK
jgi:diguanylate cyclase (GGDEF)-like protein/PAS domain S-box-containing protein